MNLLAAVRQGATLPAHASRALRRATTDSHKNRLDTTDETDRWDADQPALWTCVCAITARVLGIGADCSSGLHQRSHRERDTAESSRDSELDGNGQPDRARPSLEPA